ncbi:hypothetical protein G4B88_029679 [Cannabis sativa]|uniref:Uncharacterized protein n=1 Tax=Cannabis sativa TaxID=3483 RepID=A0A7J6EXK5_CANSA|nr:hypothetical protein G4B88_029679 [Cannabis sativa]
MAGGGIASGSTVFTKFLRPQSTQFQSAAMWGVAATTGALWLVQLMRKEEEKEDNVRLERGIEM